MGVKKEVEMDMGTGMGITGMDGASQSITVVDSFCFETELTAKLLLCEFFMAPPSALCGSQLAHAFIHVCVGCVEGGGSALSACRCLT